MMLSSEVIGLLLNKYVLGGAGILISLIVVYFKGKKAANAANALEQAEAERAQQARIRAAEAKNQFLEKQGEKKNEEINSANTMDRLLGLFDEIQSGKDKGSSSDKDPKPKS